MAKVLTLREVDELVSALLLTEVKDIFLLGGGMCVMVEQQFSNFLVL